MIYQLPNIINEKPTRDFVCNYLKEHHPELKQNGFQIKIVLRNAIKIWQRTLLCEAQNWKCCWCGCEITELRNRKHSATIEHILPKSKDGEDSIDNYAAACYRCNNNRGSTNFEKFLLKVQNEKTTLKYEQIRKLNKVKIRILMKPERITYNAAKAADFVNN